MKNKTTLSHRNIEPENSTLYLVATPIGNLSDISNRALNILSNVCFIACEDTRQTKKLMNKYKLSNHLVSFNHHNSFKKIPQFLDDLRSGKSLALVSDAGMPGICDPGEELVKSTKDAGYDVICIPGPCAAITALVASGLPSSRFNFEGFLPRKRKDRDERIFEISKSKTTTIIYESPHRLKKLLNELKLNCGGSRELQVARELTKKFEEHIGKRIDDVIKFFEDKEPKGEFTILLKGIEFNKNSDINNSELRKELHELVNIGLSLPLASKYLAKKYNISKSIIYGLFS